MKNLAKIFLPLLALSLLFAAGCSSDSEGSSAPEYCGNYTSTQNFKNTIDGIVNTIDNESIKGMIQEFIKNGMSLTINENGTAKLMTMVDAKYTADGNTITFTEYTGNAEDETIKIIADKYFSSMLEKPFTYEGSALYGPFGENGSSIPCFTKI